MLLLVALASLFAAPAAPGPASPVPASLVPPGPPGPQEVADPVPGAPGAVDSAGNDARDRIDVVVLYRDSVAGQRHLDGARAAIAKDSPPWLKLHTVPYEDEGDGTRKLLDLRHGVHPGIPNVDLILGPMDSGVFIGAMGWEKQEEKETGVEIEVPVISSLVTARVPQTRSSWFFRTNVDVEQRAFAIHDVLQKRLVNSTTIIFEDTEFGRRAEQAYKEQFIRDAPAGNYHAIPFSTEEEGRDAAWEVVETRPESVGIFARRSSVLSICHDIAAQKAELLPYEPLLFSVLDLRLVADPLPEIYYVTATLEKVLEEAEVVDARGNPKTPTRDPHTAEDIYALSYDTTRIVCDLIGDVLRTEGEWNPRVFREDFASVLQAGPAEVGELTGMTFADFANSSGLLVRRHRRGLPPRSIAPGVELPAHKQLAFKVGLVMRRYGYMPILLALILVGTSFALNLRDILRWYGGRTFAVLRNPWFLGFASFNMLVVLGLYVFLAETGRVAYDSVWAAILIALAPSAIFKSNWFETAAGQAIGPKGVYDKLMVWFNEKLTAQFYFNRARQENVLVYYNSLPFLRERVREIYRKTRPPDRAKTLLEAFDHDLGAAPCAEDKLRVCADHLLRRLRWDELYHKGCVPERFRRPGGEGPLALVRKIVQTYVEAGIGSEDLDVYIRSRLKNSIPGARRVYESKIKETVQERGRIFVQVRFLLLQLAADADQLKDAEAMRRCVEKARREGADDRIGQVLVRGGVVSQEGVKKALEDEERGGLRLGARLVEAGLCSQEQVDAGLREQQELRAAAAAAAREAALEAQEEAQEEAQDQVGNAEPSALGAEPAPGEPGEPGEPALAPGEEPDPEDLVSEALTSGSDGKAKGTRPDL